MLPIFLLLIITIQSVSSWHLGGTKLSWPSPVFSEWLSLCGCLSVSFTMCISLLTTLLGRSVCRTIRAVTMAFPEMSWSWLHVWVHLCRWSILWHDDFQFFDFHVLLGLSSYIKTMSPGLIFWMLFPVVMWYSLREVRYSYVQHAWKAYYKMRNTGIPGSHKMLSWVAW